MTNRSYAIIWQQFDKGSDVGLRLKATNEFGLPYFVDGIDKTNFEKKLPVNLNPLHLILGLLVGYFDKPPAVDTAFAKQNTKQILIEHLEAFKTESLEDLILDFAAHLREQHGPEASLQALMTGVELVPDSNNIKYDGALDLYSCMEDGIIQNKAGGTQKLAQLLDGIDAKTLDPALLDDYQSLKRDAEKL